MRSIRFFALLLLLPLALAAVDRPLKVDRSRSYVDVDVKATADSFTARLENYELHTVVDDKERVKSAVLTFRFADLKTGKAERNAGMLDWLGGDEPAGRFELGILALTPLGRDYVAIRRALPALNVVGGCCGTDHRHVEAMCRALHAA